MAMMGDSASKVIVKYFYATRDVEVNIDLCFCSF